MLVFHSLSESHPQIPDDQLVHVAMIGPFPQMWGGRTQGGGVATHVQGLTKALPDHNVRLSVLADNTDASTPVRIPQLEKQVEIHRMIRPQGPHILRDLNRLGLRRIGRLAWRTLSHPQLRGKAPLSRQVKLVGQAANFDRFLSAQQPDLVHVHHAEYRAFLCQQVLKIEAPLIATVHGVSLVVGSQPDWLVSLIQANYRRADWLIAVSDYVKEVIVQHGADPSRITVIPNGVDINAFAPVETRLAREQLALPPDRFLVLFVGSLKPWKGVNVLLKAAQRCADEQPSMQVIILGAGPERESLTQLVNQLDIAERVRFLGPKPLTEMPEWYQACDVLVLPSRAEGFGLTALEAMSCRRPVIVSFPPMGRHSAVIQGETGLLTDYGNVEQLAAALSKLIASPELAASLGAAARRLVEQEFTWEIVARKTAEVYRTLLSERRKGLA